MASGDIDIYAEYTGTALTVVLKREVINDPQKAYDAVKKDYKSQYDLEWLGPFGFNNTHAITVRKEDAEKNGWKNISDLKGRASTLKMGAPAEFTLRPDGYPGLKRVYGLAFQSVVDMDPGLMYQALDQKEIDVIPAFSTDGRILAYGLFSLRDDKELYPPYYAAPIVRAGILQKNPSLRAALAPLAGLLSDKTMQQLNYQADEKKRSPAAIAAEFLKEMGLIE
ncbi:MAG: glycine/betaine ABC transporter substrate-binding protein [Chloroflexi bacterium]|nr:glycine/betaine ABC transporter substrate-binding protein [Chloroflexota bacterium]